MTLKELLLEPSKHVAIRGTHHRYNGHQQQCVTQSLPLKQDTFQSLGWCRSLTLTRWPVGWRTAVHFCKGLSVPLPCAYCPLRKPGAHGSVARTHQIPTRPTSWRVQASLISSSPRAGRATTQAAFAASTPNTKWPAFIVRKDT